MHKISKRSNGRLRVQMVFDPVLEPSLTQQAFASECDINNILAKYQKTQLLTHVMSTQGSYGDFTNVSDYPSALNALMDAEARFMGLPATIRERFANDPSNLLSFVSDSKNYGEAVSLGLIEPSKAKAYLDSQISRSSEPSSPPPSKAKSSSSSRDD